MLDDWQDFGFNGWLAGWMMISWTAKLDDWIAD